MNKLIAYGCSYTQGIGLRDLNNEHLPIPSDLAWPSLVANHFGVPCINQGRGGWSNKMIAHTMMQDLKSRDPDDLVIVMWTGKDRYVKLKTHLTDPSELFHIGVWQAPTYNDDISEWPEKFPEVEAFFRHIYSSYDMGFHDLMMITAVNRSYEQAGIKLINVCMPTFNEDHKIQYGWFTDYPILVFDDQHLLGSTRCYHPNEASHEAFSKRLLTVI